VFGYTFPPPELREVVQAWLRNRHSWQVGTEAIYFLPGVMRAVNVLGRAVGRPGDALLVQPPVYYPFFDVPANSDRQLQQVELLPSDGRYEIDFEAFDRAITERTRLFILCNPHNPVGRVYTRSELERMAETCLRHGIVICSDEIHSDLVYSGYTHVPIAALSPEVAEQTVTVLAPSKTFNIPGLRFGIMIAENRDLRQKIQAAGAGLVSGSNLMAYAAALAAYRDGEDWLAELLDYLEDNRDILSDLVQTRLPGVRMATPEATYLGWLDCRCTGIQGNPQVFFLERARVALNDGARFGPGGEGFVRLNFACPRATLIQALEHMEVALLECTTCVAT
jgi:cystathionine beta-lyase